MELQNPGIKRGLVGNLGAVEGQPTPCYVLYKESLAISVANPFHCYRTLLACPYQYVAQCLIGSDHNYTYGRTSTVPYCIQTRGKTTITLLDVFQQHPIASRLRGVGPQLHFWTYFNRTLLHSLWVQTTVRLW